VNLFAYQDIPFRDADAFLQFMDLHMLDHQSIQSTLLTQGVIIDGVPLGSENKLSEVWLEMHNNVHRAIDTALNIVNVDFSFLDTKDESSFQDWLKSHYDQHVLYEQALGFT
jgi:hypothetical protein